MRSFIGKVAVVTGAGSGIGRSLAYELANRGVQLALNDINADGLADTAKHVGSRGRRVTSGVFDVTDAEAFQAFADETVAEHGNVDIVVNNAGMFSRFAPFTDLSAEEFSRYFAINFGAAVNGARSFLPHLLSRPEASLVNMSSIYGFGATPLQSPYIAAKFAVRGFTDALRYELLKTNVHVLCVHPGAVKTNLGVNAPALSDDEHRRNVKLQQSGARTTPEKVARCIVRGIARGQARLVIGPDGFLFDMLGRFAPTAYPRLTLPVMRFLEPRMLQAVNTLAARR